MSTKRPDLLSSQRQDPARPNLRKLYQTNPTEHSSQAKVEDPSAIYPAMMCATLKLTPYGHLIALGMLRWQKKKKKIQLLPIMHCRVSSTGSVQAQAVSMRNTGLSLLIRSCSFPHTASLQQQPLQAYSSLKRPNLPYPRCGLKLPIPFLLPTSFLIFRFLLQDTTKPALKPASTSGPPKPEGLTERQRKTCQ